MKRTDRLTTILALVLFLAFLAYVGAYAYRALTDRTVTAEATLTSVTEEGTASGIVVRRETVLESQEPYIDITASEGGKIAAGGAVALAMQSEEGLQRARHIRALKQEIERVSAALDGAASAEDLTVRGEKVRSALLELTGAVARGEYTRLTGAAISLRSLIFTEGGATLHELGQLQRELNSLLGSALADTSEITARESGVFSAAADGWEHLTPEVLDGLTPDGLYALIDSRADVSPDCFGKLVTDYVWYFAAVMPHSDAESLTAGGFVTLDFGKNYASGVPAVVESVSDPVDGEVAAVFRCDRLLADTLPMRETSAAVLFGQYSGIRVPDEAVQEDGGGTSVWVITAMQLERKNVSVLYTGDGFCVVERGGASDALREGNTIVVSGTELYEGKVMQ